MSNIISVLKTSINVKTSIKNNTLHSSIREWYKIPEISLKDFLFCLKDIYKVIEDKHISKSNEDPFIKAVVKGYTKIDEEEWKKLEKARLFQKALEGKMGDFHEELMGKLPGFITYPLGHSTGCDVGSIKGTFKKEIVIEVKNRDNTMNSSSAKSVISNLKKHADAGIIAVLVEVNCPNGKVARFGAPENVHVLNGEDAYTLLSGRKGFFKDLLQTIQYAFETFKTHDALKESLGIP
jgi:hypothetical protein